MDEADVINFAVPLSELIGRGNTISSALLSLLEIAAVIADLFCKSA